MNSNTHRIAGWFAGPKAENGEWFEATIQKIVSDYYAWRRNYFPEDGVILGSKERRDAEPFRDAFEDKLIELLARLKADYPFQSPRYAAHMVSDQSLSAIAGYFAAMLYNPNNVTSEAAPVTVRLELEACRLISQMLGYDQNSWAHLTSGGTVANIEALWIARSVKYLPYVTYDIRQELGLPISYPEKESLSSMTPSRALSDFAECFKEVEDPHKIIKAYLCSPHNVVQRGLSEVTNKIGRRPVVIVPETSHYCIAKATDILGFGRDSIKTVPVDEDYRMRVEDLERLLSQSSSNNEDVIAVVAVVGTTEEGAIDPIDKIIELRKTIESTNQSSFWLHADAAYGGYLRTLITPKRLGLGAPHTTIRINGKIKEIELNLPEHYACDALECLGECDSITIDPHKLGYVPYPAGAICFKSNLVKPIARQTAPYLEEAPGDLEKERGSEAIGVYILEGSKPGAAAAAVWMSHTLIQLDTSGHGQLIQQTIRNASELNALLQGYPKWANGVNLHAVSLCQPGSNILCFAFRPNNNASLKRINLLNKTIYSKFSGSEVHGRRVYDQNFFISRTTLSPNQYSSQTVMPFLDKLGVSISEFNEEGIFLLRTVLMNPWYELAKSKGNYYLSEMVSELYREANAILKNLPEE